VRDLLLEPDPAQADHHRHLLESSQAQVRSLVASYGAMLRPEEYAAFTEFRGEVQAFFDSLRPAVEWNTEQRRKFGYAFMQTFLLPRRRDIVRLTDQLARVNQSQMRMADQEVRQLFGRFRTRLLLLLILTFSTGLALAGLSFFRVLKLERETARRLAETISARSALRDLSSRLVEVQEEERKAISRELHDEIGQSLSGVLLGIANLTALIPPSALGEDAQRELGKLRRLTERTVSTVRDLSLLLRPSMLDDLGLVAALQWQARETSRNSPLQVTVHAESVPDDLSEEEKTCVYRVVQEALRNAVRHAHARSVTIDLAYVHGSLELSVTDDGRGFSPEQEKGLGLLGMQERVKHLNGSFEISSARGSGSAVRVLIPHPGSPVLSHA
jgi:signal transduction histidine kinase